MPLNRGSLAAAVVSAGACLLVASPDAQSTAYFVAIEGAVSSSFILGGNDGLAIDLGNDGRLDVVLSQLRFQVPGLLPLVAFQADSAGEFTDGFVAGGDGLTEHPRHLVAADLANVSVATNTGAARVGRITVNGQDVVIRQSAWPR